MKMYQFIHSFVFLALSASVAAGADTEFTYQGRLLDAGEPANGAFNVDFNLWDDATAGNQVGATNTFNSLPILDGLFTVELDFGGSAFDNNDRWLEIRIDGVPLVPRQPITRTPYAIQTRGVNVDDVGNVGIGTSTPNSPLHVESNGAQTIFVQNTAASGSGQGILALSQSNSGFAVIGSAQAASGLTYGVYGESFSTSGRGVYGNATAISGNNFGVHGRSRSTGGCGVFGEATSPTGNTYGGLFFNNSNTGYGVYGWATALSGPTYGVFGSSSSNSGRAVFGAATASNGTAYGVYGSSNSSSGRGVYGEANSLSGITYGGQFIASSSSGHGVLGIASASSGTTYGGRFNSESNTGFAGYFEGNGNDAVYVENTSDGRGLRAVAPADTAVWAQTTTGFAGVHGQNASSTGLAVYGQATATSGTNYGVYGSSSSASGFDFYAGGAGVNYGASSSRRWKNNVVPIGNPLDKLSKLQGVYFDWDDEHGGAHDVGMIAEEVGAVLPEVVQYEENGIDAIGMDYSKMTPLLVEAVNALRKEKVDEIRAMTEEKNAEIAALQYRLDSLEQLVEQLASIAKEQSK